MINYEDFKKIDIRIGRVLSAEKIPGSEKLIKIIFDMGTEQRQVVSGIAKSFEDPSILIGKEIPLIVNLETRVLMGHESQGMILAVDSGDKAVLLHPGEEVPPGSFVK